MHVILHNTRDANLVQYYDCIYYTNETSYLGEGEGTVPVKYCQQPSKMVKLDRSNDTCLNNSTKLFYFQLSELSITPNDLLKWPSSSVEHVDEYASYLRNKADNNYLCNCTIPGTFGKFCENKFYYDATTFDEAVKEQFGQIRANRYGNQLHNNRPCYSTLGTTCNSGLMCLDWRDICDGTQQCMDGVDEDFCHLLEFNECDENEYRCSNGMCLPDEYWLDGT
ncbi:unnamed protein product [Didymodactylos carnosus]|uniref:Uncharacterized protein n=1 Tax=Didymodactylos carnosus TaxID=1234261 RepID=A0A8S2FQY6_9BILA|nr:unnamed protein product [Didymodactylos carnosus]CAF4328365.1 unnamed protein product [Didymodactylos carnosus]